MADVLAELNLVDWDQLDPERWPPLDFPEELPALDRWRVLDVLDRAGLVRCPGSAPAVLRLWRAGRRTDEQLAATWTAFVRAPPWVADLLRAGGVPSLLDPELAAAVEVAVRLAPSEVDGMVAARALLDGEPSPAAGGWRRAPKADGHGTPE